MPFENQEQMFLARAKSCKKEGDRLWKMAILAEEAGKPIEEIEALKKQAWFQYNQEKENLKKAEENKGKSFKKSNNKGDKNE